MKTKEFIKLLNEVGFRAELMGCTHTYYEVRKNSNGRLVAEVFIKEPYSFKTIYGAFDDLLLETRANLYDILDKYARTPVEERAEEEKFYLKFSNYDSDMNYFNLSNNGKWGVSGQSEIMGYQTKFTTDEIDDLQGKFPEIDFMRIDWKEVE